jgi:hypothetical protein
MCELAARRHETAKFVILSSSIPTKAVDLGVLLHQLAETIWSNCRTWLLRALRAMELPDREVYEF